MPASNDGGHRGEGGGWFPPPSQPRKVAGGIRVSARGARPGQTWWARRWFAALEAMGLGERLERGRAYARGGQVLTLDVTLGEVRATVQGTRRTPYETTMRVGVLTQLEWLAVARALATQGAYRAALLADELPEDAEAVFARSGASLFPQLEDDLTLTCTCDDWAVPCKHAAAACFVLGELLDHDPFLLLRLRGIEREVLLALLDAAGEQGVDADAHVADDSKQQLRAAALPATAANVSVEDAPAGYVDLQPPALDAPLVQLLGPLPQWTGREPFLDTMSRLVARIGSDPRALDAAQR